MDKKDQLDEFLDKFLNDEDIDFGELEIDETFAELFEISALLKKNEAMYAKSKEQVFNIVHAEFDNDQSVRGASLFSLIAQFFEAIFDFSSHSINEDIMLEACKLNYVLYPNGFSSSLKSSQFLYNYTISSLMVPLGLKTLC